MNIQASEISKILKEQIKNFGDDTEVAEVGKVLSVGDGIARVYGLDKVQAGEMVEFPGGTMGMALNLEIDNVGVVIFGSDRDIKEGDLVKRTVDCGCTSRDGFVGRVVDGLGNPVDGKGPIKSKKDQWPMLKPRDYSPKICTRTDGNRSKICDSLIPMRGAKLIIGDGQTGKAAVAIDATLNQKSYNDAAEPMRVKNCIVSMWR